MKNRIFISSTCYDLIDLRHELYTFFKSNGLNPILSDIGVSEFSIYPDRNSIETCLANVRDSEIFIIILSQRYGPTLGTVGYEDISATHLEYLEAKNTKIPIFMYVRDRLEAELSIFEKNPGLELSWVKKRDYKIFELMQIHKRITSIENNNWYWTFNSSIDLKEIILSDFNNLLKDRMLAKYLLKENISMVALRDIRIIEDKSRSKFKVEMDYFNGGKNPVCNLNVEFKIPSGKVYTLSINHILQQNQSIQVNRFYELSDIYGDWQIYFKFEDISGLGISDNYTLLFDGNVVSKINYSGKKLL